MASGWPPAQPEAGGAFFPDFPAQIWANKWDCESYDQQEALDQIP